MSDRAELLRDARHWLEQERVWDNEIYCSPSTEDASPRVGEVVASSSATGGGKFVVPVPPLVVPPTRGGEASASKAVALGALYEKYKSCTRCPLGETRIKFVFGVGNPEASVLFIGEGPGYEEDRKGEPFVGKAGQLLDKIMASIGLNRENAYIANIVKCHPMTNPQMPEARGNDRAPNPLEVETCSPILRRQIAIIQPKIIVTLGSPSSKAILSTSEGITRLRGRLMPFPVETFYPQDSEPITPQEREALMRIQVLPTYHPAALLRNPDLKKDVWTDMKLLRDTLAALPNT